MSAAYFEDHPIDPDKVILRKPRLDQGPDYERGFIDGMMYQVQTSVYKAVNAMSQPTYHIPSDDKRIWVGLTEREQGAIMEDLNAYGTNLYQFAEAIEAKLKEKNT